MSDVFASSGEQPIDLDAAEAGPPPAEAQISSDEFFRRARERLTFDVPLALTDPH